MDSQSRNQQVASAVFRAGLLDEPALRSALAAAGDADLASWLVSSGRLRPEEVSRALSASRTSGAFRAISAAEIAPTVVGTPPPLGDSSSTALRAALARKPGAELPPGTQLGPYVLKKLLARGGMGAVFVAQHATIGRTVALKVLLSGEQASDEQVARFLVEARTASKLSHPNVVPIYDVGEAAGVRYMTMELVQGGSLRKRIKEKGPLEARRALRYLEQVARGVAAAHGQGIIHRDLKPENVLIDEAQDVAKVMDFGLAKEVGDEAARGLTVSGAVLGTPAYMAPEQADGQKVGPLADVYGLGAILYECLTGKPPFEGQTLANILTQVMSRDPVAPRSIRPALSRDVETICLHALEKAPEKRYASAQSMADDAARWLAGEAILARPVPPLERAWRWTRRRIPYVVGATVAVAAIIGAVLWAVVIVPARELAALSREAAAVDASVREIRTRAENLAAEDRPAAERIAGVRKHADEIRALSARTPARVKELVKEAPADDALLTARIWKAEAVAQTKAAIAKDGDEAKRLEAARDALAAIAQPDVLAEARRELAKLWFDRGVELGGTSPEAEVAFARAYRADPTSNEGRRAIAEVAVRRESSTSDELIRHLLALESKLPPETEAKLRLERARRRFGTTDVGGAVADLDAIKIDYPDARAFSTFVRPLATYADIAWPEGIVPAGDLHFTIGAKPRIEMRDGGTGAGFICDIDLAGKRLVPVVKIAAPRISGATLDRFAFGGTPERPLAAYFDQTRKRLWICDGRDGHVLRGGEVARNAEHIGKFEFIDLDDDASRAELVMVMGPNAGDSVIARIDADGNIETEEFDIEGRHSPTMANAQCYIDDVTSGTIRGSRRLIAAYGAWGANDIRFYEQKAGRVARCTTERAEVGKVQRLALFDLYGEGSPVVLAAHLPSEEPWKPEWTPPGIAVYECDATSIRKKPRARIDLDLPAGDVACGFPDLGVVDLWPARIGGRAYAFYRLRTRRPDGTRRERLRVASLDGAEHRAIVDVPMPWAIVGVSELDRAAAGTGNLVTIASSGLRVLGPGGDKKFAPPKEDPRIADDKARAMAVGFLASFGFRDEALGAVVEQEKQGVTPATEALGLSFLREEQEERALREGATPKRDTFVERCLAFGDTPGRSLRGRTQTHLLAALDLARAGQNARAADVLASGSGADLPIHDSDVLGRLERTLRLARAPLARVDLDLRGDFRPPGGKFLSDDPALVRIVPGRGLVATIGKRSSFAGMPVEIANGTLGLVVELETEGRVWDGHAEIGLFREPSRSRYVGGLGVGVGLWKAAAVIQESEQGFAPYFGVCEPPVGQHPIDWGDMLDPRTRTAITFGVGWRHLYGGKFRATIEHDPASGWCRYKLEDAERGKTLREREGITQLAFAPGDYVLGIRTHGADVDWVGQNFSPKATIAVARVTLDSLASAGPSPTARPESDPIGLEGDAVLADRKLVAPDQVAARYARAIAATPDAAELLVHSAIVRSRAGDGAGARADLARALDGDAYGFFRAIERDGIALDDDVAARVREVLRDALRALNASLAARPDDVAALEKRAFVQRLRGEVAPVLDDLAAADKLAGKREESRVYLLSSLSPDAKTQDELAKLRTRPVTPLRHEFLRAYWLPLEDVADPIALVKEEHEKHLASGRVTHLDWDVWLRRWIELRPRDPEPRARRVQLLGRISHAIQQQLWWQRLEDLRALAELRPDDANALATVALYETAAVDLVHARRHLALLRERGVDVAPLLAQVRPSFVKKTGDVETGAEFWKEYSAELLEK